MPKKKKGKRDNSITIPEERKVYATLFLVTGEDEQEALRQIVYGVRGFGSILGDKIQCVQFDPEKGDPELMLPDTDILKRWLAAADYNRQTNDYEKINLIVQKVVDEIRDEIKLKEGEEMLNPTVN